MNSIGETLRRERLRHNLSLEQVAQETKINLKFLQAIEAEDFARLPGGVFARSFVRQYARLLGLDEEELSAELQQSMEPAAPAFAPAAHQTPPVAIELPKVPDWDGSRSRSGSSLPALALVVVVMLVCSAVYAWWQKSRRPAPVAQEPAPQAQVSAPPAPAPAANPAPAPQTPPAEAPAAQQPTPAPPSESAPAPTPAPAPAGTVTSAERQVPADAAMANAPVQVLLTAEEPTWVSARSDGKFVYAGTLQPNESKGLHASENLRLVVGNAGGVAITLNGKPVPPIGPKGQVRVVQLSSGGVQIVPPVKPAAAAPDPL